MREICKAAAGKSKIFMVKRDSIIMAKQPDEGIEGIVRRIGESIRPLQMMMKNQLPYIRSEIKNIIHGKKEEIEPIEHLLDTLLNYGQMGIGIREFKRLNKYYASVNKQNARLYAKWYKEENEQ